MELFAFCTFCLSSGCKATITSIIGAMIVVNQLCEKCGETRTWHNSPYIGAIPSSNLLLSGAILFSGGLPGKILKFLKFFGAVTYR